MLKTLLKIVPETVSEIELEIFNYFFSKNWINEIENLTPPQLAKSQTLQEKKVTSFLDNS